jgi:hypothetical protein
VLPAWADLTGSKTAMASAIPIIISATSGRFTKGLSEKRKIGFLVEAEG